MSEGKYPGFRSLRCIRPVRRLMHYVTPALEGQKEINLRIADHGSPQSNSSRFNN